MDDLRKSYNVSKVKRSIFKVPNLLKIKLSVYRNITVITILALLIFNPTLIGSYVGQWLNDIHTSFISNISITSTEWYNLLLTILAFIIFYKLAHWRSSK